MQKTEVGPSPFTIYKVNRKWIKDLNIKAKTLQKKHSGNASQHWIWHLGY